MDRAQENLRLFLTTVLAVAALSACSTSARDDFESPAPLPSADSTSVMEAPVATFERLNEELLDAVLRRDVEAARAATVGPAQRRSLSAIRELRRDNVVDQTRFETMKITIKVESRAEILLEQTRRVFPCYRTDEGEIVTREDIAVEQRVRWRLVFRSEWLLHSGDLISDRRIRGGEAACA